MNRSPRMCATASARIALAEVRRRKVLRQRFCSTRISWIPSERSALRARWCSGASGRSQFTRVRRTARFPTVPETGRFSFFREYKRELERIYGELYTARGDAGRGTPGRSRGLLPRAVPRSARNRRKGARDPPRPAAMSFFPGALAVSGEILYNKIGILRRAACAAD